MEMFSKDGQEVELRILGYLSPINFDNEWDANWLRIYIKVESTLGNWQTIDSSLTTWEVKELIEWFDKLSQDIEVEYSNMIFVEPNLAFELINNTEKSKTVQIRFNAESRPKSAKSDINYLINFNFSNKDLAKIANDLKNEYEKFPIRPFPTNTNIISKN